MNSEADAALSLPGAGAAYAFPTGDGRFSVCRIILGSTSDRAKAWGFKAVLVASSAWMGNAVPEVSDPALRPMLNLTHHNGRGWENMLWVGQTPPPELTPIGTIEPTEEEKQIYCSRFGNWRSLIIQPLIQWRWDNDRSALLVENATERAREAEAWRAKQREREAYLKRVTLDDLLEHDFFPRWKTYPPTVAIIASRRIMIETVERLIELGSHSTVKERKYLLKECIESFNELDSEIHFIETDEREDLCHEFEAIVHACGLGSRTELMDKWRKW
jgi:hypothetical protein